MNVEIVSVLDRELGIVGFYLIQKNSSGRTMERVDPLDLPQLMKPIVSAEKPAKPSFIVSVDVGCELMDQLWGHGFRPDGYSEKTGVVKISKMDKIEIVFRMALERFFKGLFGEKEEG